MWDVHEQGLAKTERALQEKLDECRRKHDNENQVRVNFLLFLVLCLSCKNDTRILVRVCSRVNS